ncbi:hypothetical protein A2533_04470 [Candidatus Falkowbacteria bacterium RIFOXYD2_FULL_35_9]|uniref:Metal-dependent hydrolase n=1 Tax=Candidatus Falkowbacteria bacterium RIFOXYC2_FULL_36_12 TaxID=1798002 RepID=A0A1F5T095_9BACT|nr:MAG: hypothetical protein A2300_04125 [Candidatus Falkowbacteria bacterium RIFOXYB2_FULL_35_7]OGF32377.1 MAG: hypothetical protein A2478_03600 [Candidatus Falkowbacteria bacterium RIFOXYC2_FULL_36_12]OGF34739.1 MAG: hypothetical protein A2223_00955 [Candidatus Falkowbacteria bacterium RIFOXYA2_FULL_35_8]OGF48371.1 MAG: hypothetical protein A2533_04470 [Candidatus Falkowbacteria bacterium RIFOXYD2_FULL_35_9]
MTLKQHLIVSTVVGLGFGWFFHSWSAGLYSWLIGWAIDLDHLIDYFIYLIHFEKKFSIKMFFSGKYFDQMGKIFVIYHSWEYSLISIIFYYATDIPISIIFSVTFSYILHLYLDVIAYKSKFRAYSLLYRLSVKFDKNKICAKQYEATCVSDYYY